MYTKSKNSFLFVIFILIILLIVAILIISVYNTKQNTLEQYKVSLNNVLYDEDYSFISLEDDAILKKEWDNNFYLYAKNDVKYSLGEETVLYDRSTRQITIYGNVYQVFSNGDVTESSDKVVISKLDEFQFFKLNDRKYLIVGAKITAPGVSTIDYLIVSIDRAGNASLLNHSVNIKTINPLSLKVGDRVFDVANEKLIIGEEKIDLKKINGSTNEYVQGTNQNSIFNNGSSQGNSGGAGGSSGSGGASSSDNSIWQNLQELVNNNSGGNSSGNGSNNKVFKEIVNQIITLSGLIPTNTNKTSLYKNVSLRDISVAASYLDVYYSIIDPENKYLNVYLAIQKVEGFESNLIQNANYMVDCNLGVAECIYLDKDNNHYRKTGLIPGSKYIVSLNYIESGKSSPTVSDVISVVTESNPTSVRFIEQDSFTYTYNVKLYNEYAFDKAEVQITDCNGVNLSKEVVYLDIVNALGANGATGKITRDKSKSTNIGEFICLELKNVYLNNQPITVDSYHKIKIS